MKLNKNKDPKTAMDDRLKNLDSSNLFDNAKLVKELSPKDFDPNKVWQLKSKKCTLVIFYCAWCGHCKAAVDVWTKLANYAAFVDFAAFNCQKHNGHIRKIKNDMPQMVTSYPTIIGYVKGDPVETFEGDRNFDNLLKFAQRICRSSVGSILRG